jgi:Cu+-exporting ATPase
VKILKKYTEAVEKLEEKWNTVIFIASDKELLWIIAVADKVKDSSKEAIQSMQKEGIDVYMITWDNKATAYAIWKQVWLKEENIFAEILPEDKANIIRDIQYKGKKVAMVWDWINDAPALTLADTWIAIWAWTDVAIESADIVLMKSDLLDVLKAIKLSKSTVRNIKQNLFFSFWYNSLGIPIAAWILFPFTWILLSPMIAALAMSMSSVTVLMNALRLKKFWK